MQLQVLATGAWAETVAAEFTRRLEPSGLRLCLATGATPVPVYALLAGRRPGDVDGLLARRVRRSSSGAPGPMRNHAADGLLDRVPAGEFHSPEVDAADLPDECRRYRQLIDDGGLDLAVLGLGLNGHLGLNEPGSGADQPTRVVELTGETQEGARRYGADPPPTWGLAVGMAEILAAREVWLLVTGPAKSKVLASVVSGPVTDDVPASLLRGHPNAIVWADDQAAALVTTLAQGRRKVSHLAGFSTNNDRRSSGPTPWPCITLSYSPARYARPGDPPSVVQRLRRAPSVPSISCPR